jgi:hypothetical protein
MDFNLKKYRIIKTKKKLKNSELIFFFHSAKIKSQKWILIEKKLKKLKLQYNQISNKTTSKILNNSIFKNLEQIVCSVVLLLNTRYKSTQIQIKTLNKDLEPLFVLLFLKLNNKIYTYSQFKTLNELSHRKTVLNFHNSLDKCLKTTIKLTNNIKSK